MNTSVLSKTKISFTVLSAFFLTFFLLSIFINPFESSEDVTILTKDLEENFYSNFKSNNETIFLLGSSHTARINHNYIQNEITKDGLNYEIFNLAIKGEEPKDRLKSINKIISLKPEIIIYVVAYPDFANMELKSDILKPESYLPEFNTFFSNSFDSVEDGLNLNFDRWSSPKIQTLNSIKNLIGIKDNQSKIDLKIKNAPFYGLRESHSIILDELSLKRTFEATNTRFKNILPDNENIFAFDQSMEILKDNQIKTIILTLPISDISADTLSKSDKEFFNEIILTISQKYDIDVFYFHEQFGSSPIWNDHNHIAFGDKSTILNDIVKNIIMDQQ